MAIDWKKGYKTKAGLVVTPEGRLVYPGLFRASLPKGETDEKKAAFQCTLLFPKGSDFALLQGLVDAAATEKFGAAPQGGYKFKIKKPFLKTEDQPRLADFAADYPVMIRSANKRKPATVFLNMKAVEAEEEVYAGRWAVMALNAYAWSHPTGGKGVSFGLNHVQILRDDEALPFSADGGGNVRVEDTFEGVADEGGAASDAAALFD